MTLDRSTPPTIKDFGHLSVPQCRRLTLDNGIKLSVIDHGEFEVNRLTMSWIGGANDVDSLSTLILATDLMREGSEWHSGAEIAETLDFNGAWLKSNIHSHHSSLILHSLNHRFSHILPTIFESITSPRYPTAEFEISREKIAKRKELNLSKVAYLSNQSNHQLIFGDNHPCAKDETPDEVRGITHDNVENLHHKVFNANGCELFLAGRITPEIEDAVNKTFSQLKYNDDFISHRVIPMLPAQNKLQIINVDEALQSSITMSIPTINRNHHDYIDLRYAIMALGGYFGSRLMTNIREDKGYTYGISSALLGNWEGGVMTISTQCDNRYTQAVIKECKKEIELMKTDNFSAEELNRLKRYAMSQIAGILDSPFSIMDYYENQRHVLTPIDYFDRMQHSLKNLSSQRIATLAQQYLHLDEMRISIAGNRNEIGEQYS